MRDRVRFLHRGRIEEVRDCEPTATVLDWLRGPRGLKGTKEGCAEGDCGACTVVVGEIDGERLRYRAVNACIQFLPTLDGRELVTVEDLAGSPGRLHPVQQAMVDCHGSQCGFCTPGFVMSLFALYHEDPGHAPRRHEIDLALAGNLCRCTGYAPIVRAARAALGPGREDGFTRQARQTLERLRALDDDQALALEGPSGRWYAPRRRDELAGLLAEHPDALLVAGATDVGLWVTKQLRDFPVVIYTGRVRELLAIERDGQDLLIGAAVTYSDALEAITDLYPGFRTVLERLGGLQVRNAGTVGGNIANGSPIGDTPPGLIAAGARLEIGSADGSRTIDLEDFFIDYGKQDLRPGEFVERIHLPAPPPGREFRSYKVSRRFEQDISALCGAFALDLDDGRVRAARVAFGGMAGTPKRARACEAALTGEAWNETTVARAMDALEQDYQPLTDHRASAAYRMTAARNLLRRLFLETTATDAPVRLEHRYGQAGG